MLGGWQVSGITRYNSAAASTSPPVRRATIFGDTITLRADGVEGVDPNSAPDGGRTEAQWLNPAAFTRPATNTLGTLPRNAVVGPSFFSSDLSLSKNIRLAGRARLQLRAEAFNVFNQKNYRCIATNLTAANFGTVTAFEPQRIMQFGIKALF